MGVANIYYNAKFVGDIVFDNGRNGECIETQCYEPREFDSHMHVCATYDYTMEQQ